MSRSCAKPTCSDSAVSWFDLSRETQEVTRTSAPTELGIALCRTHSDRFSVPNGWSLIDAAPNAIAAQVASAASVADVLDEDATGERSIDDGASIDAGSGTHREHDRDNPWFVPASTDDNGSTNGGSGAVVSDALGNPTQGSMLHRAFHGPTSTDDDTFEADQSGVERGLAPVDELSPRRRARSTSDDPEEEALGGYREFELPFPPHASQQQKIAVS